MFEIQIKDPESCHFKPVELITCLAMIYSNLQELNEVCKAIAKDERSFKLEYLQKALRILRKNHAVIDFDKFERLIAILDELMNSDEAKNEE